MNDISIFIDSYHPILDDALLRSMDIMWKNHPKPIIIEYPWAKDYEKLKTLHDIYFFSSSHMPESYLSLWLSGKSIFINPVTIDFDRLNKKNIWGMSFNPYKREKINDGVIIKNNTNINVHDVIYNDKFSLVEFDYDINDETLKWYNKYWEQGKQLNITPFLYSDADNYLITTDLEFKWL